MVNNFSIALQKGTLSACEGQTVVKTNVHAIKSERSDIDFDFFWKYKAQRSEINVYFNAWHRKNLTRRFEVGDTPLSIM